MRYIFVLYLFSFALATAEIEHPFAEKPLSELSDLIESTERLLARQKSLYRELESYMTLKADAVHDLDNKELLLKTAKSARNALDIIKEENLSHLFSGPFLSEMTLFAKLAGRPRIPQ